MTAPQLSKAWTITPNVRQSFASLIGLAGWYAYQNKTALLAAGWTMVFSCDGVTGPVNANDTTDRIVSAANFATRATVAAAAQSWFVVRNDDGVQLMFTYQGASDDILRITFSPGGQYTLAGTTTNQPTAADEQFVSAATSIVDPTGSLDRVMSIFCADDTSAWRCVLFRNSSLISCLSMEKVARIAPASTFPVPYVSSNFIRMSREILNDATNVATPIYPEMQTTVPGNASHRGYTGLVFTAAAARTCRMFGASVFASGNGATNSNTLANGGIIQIFSSTFCASMGGTGALCWPIVLWGENTVNLDGPWATLVDWSQVVTTSITNPTLGVFMPGLDVADNPISDPARTNWFVALGAGALWPWKDSAPSLEIL